MSDFTIGFECPHCGAEDLEVGITIESGPTPAVFSLPEFSSPGEGAEWHADEDTVECPECHGLVTAEWIGDHLNDKVQERAADPSDPLEDDGWDNFPSGADDEATDPRMDPTVKDDEGGDA